MIYQWNDDLNIVTQQTEESKRAGEILGNLKLGCVSSKDSSDTDSILALSANDCAPSWLKSVP
jgi:hypothetical protein